MHIFEVGDRVAVVASRPGLPYSFNRPGQVGTVAWKRETASGLRSYGVKFPGVPEPRVEPEEGWCLYPHELEAAECTL